MFDYNYLSDNHLKGFDKYKYSAIDTSPLSKHVMHPFWNAIVKYTPPWIAPNLLTFAGFLCVVLQVILFYYYDYWYRASNSGDIPSWVFNASALLIFLAYTLDGIDGKQARKIGVSGPLGEMFDHGLDSWIVFFEPFCLLSVCGVVGEHSMTPFRIFLLVLSVVLNYNISHVEKYNTGTLYLPWGYDVAMWSVTVLFFIAGTFGVEAMKITFLGIKFVQVMEVAVHCTGLFTTLPIAVYNVYLSYKTRTGKLRPPLEAIRPIWSMLSMTSLFIYWMCKSPNAILEYDLRMCLMLFGTLFSNVSNRLIVSTMSSQRCELVCWLFWPLLSSVLISIWIPRLEYITLTALTVFCVLAHVHYGVCVVKQICEYYKISCFSVKRTKNLK